VTTRIGCEIQKEIAPGSGNYGRSSVTWTFTADAPLCTGESRDETWQTQYPLWHKDLPGGAVAIERAGRADRNDRWLC
jgi:hypothetical protein